MKETSVTIDQLAFGGDGVGRVEGKVVFVPGAAPGDKLLIKIVEDKEKFSRGEIVKIVKPSHLRVKARCSVFGKCGGCHWQHLDYETQLKQKERIIRESLTRIGKLPHVKILPIFPSPHPWHYRHRIQLHHAGKGKIGFRAPRSHDVVEFETCEISNLEFTNAIPDLKKNFSKLPPSFELLLQDNAVKVLPLDAEDRVFSQVNPEVNHRLVDVVLNAVFGRAEDAFIKKWTVMELYSGAGNLTLPIAKRSGKVIAVEESAASIASAEEKAFQSGITNIEFIKGSSEWGLKTIHRRGVLADIIVLDPPRRGAKEILDLIAMMNPRVVVYVSCDPPTLARDLKFLAGRHYEIEMVQPLDMFPQTYHVESVTRLVRHDEG